MFAQGGYLDEGAEMVKKLGFVFLAVVLLLGAVAVFRTLTLPTVGGGTASLAQVDDTMAARAAKHLGDAIKIETISWGDERSSRDAFVEFHDFLSSTYPASHQVMERTIISGQSLIYRWPGLDSAKAPVGLAAHIDVVPVETGTVDEWQAPPFSGAVKDGKVFGRGALDDKGAIIGYFEAVERLLADGFTPSRDVYFLFGHDEEIGGGSGAGAIVAHFQGKNIQFEWILDEGSAPVKGIIDGFDGIAALISLGEKGSTTLELTATAAGGHSATPARDTAASIVARAVTKIADNPYKAEIDETTAAFLRALAPEFELGQRFALANLWLTGRIVRGKLEEDPVTAATMRTTTAVTIIQSGTKVNILPQKARAIVNYRIHPRDTPESVRARAERLIDDDRVAIRVAGARPASAMSSAEAAGYEDISAAIRAAFGDIIIAPSVTLQGTDQRHYSKIANDAYRFMPFVIEPDDLKRIHGTDEYISIENLGRGVLFFEALLAAQ